MKILKAVFVPTVEETAAFAIIQTVMQSGQRTFTEQPNINNDVWVCSPTATGVQKVIVLNYDLGKKIAVEQGWIIESNGRLTVTSSGEAALTAKQAGKYKRPSSETLLDRGKKWSANNPILVGLIALFTIAGIFFGVLNNCFDVWTKGTALIKPQQAESKSDFSLRLIYPESPALLISNPSTKAVREIKYAFALWNLSAHTINPLPIKVTTFDWIGAKSSGGPQFIFDPAFNLKEGDHIVGSMAASCPDGERGRTYLVSIVWGVGGWTAELEKEESGSLVCPKGKITLENLAAYAKQIEMIPERLRKPILMPD